MTSKIFFMFILINYIRTSKSNFTSDNFSNGIYDSSLQLLNKENVIDTYYLYLANISKTFLSDIKFSYSGKIIYLDKYSRLDILKENIMNYRVKWIFLFDSMDEINNYSKNILSRKNEYFCNVIIIPKALYESNINNFDYLADLRLYIFYLQNETFHEIISNYDYKVNKNQYIFGRILSLNNKEYNLGHLYILAYISLIILIFCINYIKYSLNLDPRNLTFFFIRTIYFFPMIKLSITLLLIMKLNSLRIYNDLFNIGKTAVITFLAKSLNNLFKSLFITFSINISKGIDAVIGINTRPEFFNFTKKFVFVYFMYNTNLINQKYMFIDDKYFLFFSLIVESFVFYLIYKNYQKAKIYLMQELRLVILYCNEYFSSVNIKLNMTIWQSRLYFLYYFGILVLNICSYLSNIIDIEKEIYFNFIEVFAIFSYCIIYKPRRWPNNFDVYFKNEFHYFDNIFSYKINSEKNSINTNNYNKNKILAFNDESDESDNEKAKLNTSETIQLRNKKYNIKKYYIENKNYPIIVINPKFYYNLSSGLKQDIDSNLIKNCEIGYKTNE